MKQLTCEMCGSKDLIKDGGVFVCQSCGCKYSIEEAKKMLIGGTVEVKGTVNVSGTVDVNHSEEIKNLLIRARQFYNDGDIPKSEFYYNKILDIDAQNPDALKGLDIIDKTITEPNLTIKRLAPRPSGEGKTILTLDGIKYKSLNLDYITNLKLPIGDHIISFNRGMVKSEVIYITIKSRKESFAVNFKPGIFSIKTALIKIN